MELLDIFKNTPNDEPNEYLASIVRDMVYAHIAMTGLPVDPVSFGYGIVLTLEHIAKSGIPTDLEEIMHGEKVL